MSTIRLHLSIPATSRALGRLRRAMDDPVLVRAGRWFPVPAARPELDLRLFWYARLDADPACRWLRNTIRGALGPAMSHVTH